MKPYRIFLVTLLVVTALGIIIFLAPVILKTDERVPAWKIEIRNIAAALEQYRTEFNSYPIGDSLQISKALRGDNQRKIVFLEPRNSGVGVNGELLDPWGTPYEIKIVDQANYIIRSAGSNRKVGDKDDYVFDGVKHEFLK